MSSVPHTRSWGEGVYHLIRRLWGSLVLERHVSQWVHARVQEPPYAKGGGICKSFAVTFLFVSMAHFPITAAVPQIGSAHTSKHKTSCPTEVLRNVVCRRHRAAEADMPHQRCMQRVEGGGLVVRRSAHLLRLWCTSSSWCSRVSPAPARAGPAVDTLRRRRLVAVHAELGGQLPAPGLALGLVPGDLLLQARSLSLEVGLFLWWWWWWWRCMY